MFGEADSAKEVESQVLESDFKCNVKRYFPNLMR